MADILTEEERKALHARLKQDLHNESEDRIFRPRQKQPRKDPLRLLTKEERERLDEIERKKDNLPF